MTSLWITIEENSPLISYSRGWRAGTSQDDTRLDGYSQNSFMVTDSMSEYADFVFNGTSVEIYGAKRGNHGNYQVRLDDKLYPSYNGKSTGADDFQVVLFSAHNLTQGLHKVTINNTEASYLDIDFISWETTMGENANEKLHVQTVQDTNPSFTYLPSEEAWQSSLPLKNIGSFMGSSYHATETLGASLIYTFAGDGVSLYGPVWPKGSSYIIKLDNEAERTFTAHNSHFIPQTLLYHASSLGPGTHKVVVTPQLTGPQPMFAIDYAVKYTTTDPKQSLTHAKLTSLDIGLLAATVGLLILLLIGFSVMIYWWKRGIRPKREKYPIQVEPYIPTTPPPPPPIPPAYIQTTYLNQDAFPKERERYGRVDYQLKDDASSIYASTKY